MNFETVSWYLPRHNARFAVVPKSRADLHRSLRGYDLARIFCVKEERTVRNDITIQYRNRWFPLAPKQPTIVLPGTVVTVEEGLDGTITFLRACGASPFPGDSRTAGAGSGCAALQNRAGSLTASGGSPLAGPHPRGHFYFAALEDVSILR